MTKIEEHEEPAADDSEFVIPPEAIIHSIRQQLAESNLNLPKDIRGAFVTEYLYIDDNEGPTLVRLPKADWPEWASSLLK